MDPVADSSPSRRSVKRRPPARSLQLSPKAGGGEAPELIRRVEVLEAAAARLRGEKETAEEAARGLQAELEAERASADTMASEAMLMIERCSGRRPPRRWRPASSAATPRASPVSNSTMSYNVTVTLSLCNPNIYRGINYDPVTTPFSFNGSRFDESATVPAFQHAPRKTATLHVTVGGVNKPVKLTAVGVTEFQADNTTGKFDVELRLDTVMQYKGRKARCPLVVICPLKLQLVEPEVAATAFQRNKCTILRAKKSGC